MSIDLRWQNYTKNEGIGPCVTSNSTLEYHGSAKWVYRLPKTIGLLSPQIKRPGSQPVRLALRIAMCGWKNWDLGVTHKNLQQAFTIHRLFRLTGWGRFWRHFTVRRFMTRAKAQVNHVYERVWISSVRINSNWWLMIIFLQCKIK